MLKEYFGAGMLTGLEIERRVQMGDIEITPFNKSQINPNSYNLKLDKELKIYNIATEKYADNIITNSSKKGITTIGIFDYLDSHKDNDAVSIEIPDDGFVLLPGILYIGRTVEKTKTNKFIPMINGRSSGGRLGLSVHICAGFGDIGFDGTWTLEITVVHPLKIYAGDEIAQVCFFTPYGDYEYQYNGRYQGQIEATPSRFQQPKAKSSLADTFIDERKLRDIGVTLKMKYGIVEFQNLGIDLKTADISYNLRHNEFVDDDNYIYLADMDLLGNPDYASSVVIGKVFEIEDGVKVYVRRNKNHI